MASLEQLHDGAIDRPALVFIHGLGGHPLDTWRHEACAPTDCWPHWVGRDCGCDVWALGYDASLSAWREQAMGLPDQGDQVADLLATRQGLKGRRLVLVGHSMGGLVIKTLMINARTKGDARLRALADSVVGVAFVATPHTGSELASLAKALRWVLRTNEQVGDMAQHNAHLRTLNQQFRAAVDELDLPVRVYAETRKVSRRVLGIPFDAVMVVDPVSADPGLSGVTAIRMAGDHFSICKPSNAGEHIHASLCDFIRDLAAGSEAPRDPPPGVASIASRKADDGSIPAGAEQHDAPGRLAGSTDNRLQPREGRLYGRDADVAELTEFLQGDALVLNVTGIGGVGKSEVCKAALKTWLERVPDAVAWYIGVPERTSIAEFVDTVATAIGAPGDLLPSQLPDALPAGLYYLDNLESVIEHDEGVQLLRVMRDRPGVRLLASSRASMPAVFGKPFSLGVLPDPAALALFRDAWTGEETLPDDEELRGFVIDGLGGHALTVSLMARLGDCHAYIDLLRRWRDKGAEFVRDHQDQSRLGSLRSSLDLTAETLARRNAGCTALWTVAALFADGLPDDVLGELETLGGWAEARPWLVRHHIIARRDGIWRMLPPLATYALDASLVGGSGFDWAGSRRPLQAFFLDRASGTGVAASTTGALSARRWVLQHFGTLMRLMQHEMVYTACDRQWLERMHASLATLYQFRVALSRETLSRMMTLPDAPPNVPMLLGELEDRLGHIDAARKLYGRALAGFEQARDVQGLAETLVLLGGLERRSGQVDAARDLYEQALAFLEDTGSTHGQAQVLASLGDLESRLGRLDEARGLHARALEIFERERNGLGQANVLRSLGDLERRLGRVDAARDLGERALGLFEQEQDGLGQANALFSLGVLEQRLGRMDEARDFYERASALFELGLDSLGQANVQRSLGVLEQRLGRLQAARGHYDKALDFSQRRGDGLGQANTLNLLGELEARLGHLDVARGLHAQALSLLEREQDGPGQANALVSLGNLELRMGRGDAARSLYARALPLYEHSQDDLGRANTLISLGSVELLLGQEDAARAFYSQSLILYEQGQVSLGQANALRLLGNLERMQGQGDAARDFYDRALVLYEQLQDGLGQANILRSLGDLERRWGSEEAAGRFYDQALALYEREQDRVGQVNTRKSRGDLFRDMGRAGDAIPIYRETILTYAELGEPMGLAYSHADLARCLHAMGDVDGSGAALAEALMVAKRTGVPSVMNYVGAAFSELQGDAADAEEWLRARAVPPAVECPGTPGP